ncbi:MAG: phosphopantetheine-binding protein [Phycisphaeraceae bacterium]
MTIPTRTPEGETGRCPICGQAITIEPSSPLGDAPCPACGQLLCVLRIGDAVRFLRPNDPAYLRIIEQLAKVAGVDPEELRANPSLLDGLDSLDTVEFTMMMEEWDE